jgi:hypothetical protein
VSDFRSLPDGIELPPCEILLIFTVLEDIYILKLRFIAIIRNSVKEKWVSESNRWWDHNLNRICPRTTEIERWTQVTTYAGRGDRYTTPCMYVRMYIYVCVCMCVCLLEAYKYTHKWSCSNCNLVCDFNPWQTLRAWQYVKTSFYISIWFCNIWRPLKNKNKLRGP